MASLRAFSHHRLDEESKKAVKPQRETNSGNPV
jgi:hypothetical protein